MDFADKMSELSSQIPKRLEHIETEEATKNAFVMPFIRMLGYNIFDPTEVVPEFTADVGVKKGEKVDYAIMQNGKPIIIMEVKSADVKLSDSHISQLYRYFGVTEARLGILTNGLTYRFYSDLDEPNKMDKRPFMVLDMNDVKPWQVEELKKFTKEMFDIEGIISIASSLKYTREIKRLLSQQLAEPDDDFVKIFARQVYEGVLTQAVREQFAELVKDAFRELLNERIANRLQSALVTDTDETDVLDDSTEFETVDDKRRVETTEQEILGYMTVKAIVAAVIDPNLVVMRDTLSYCGVLFDDNNRQPIARLHFNRGQKYIGLFDADKNEERIPIETINDIYQHAERLKATAASYEAAEDENE